MTPDDPHLPYNLRDLLTQLPDWNKHACRLSFAEQALGDGHRVLAQINWDGKPKDIAWELAKHCQAFNNSPVVHRRGLSPLCALLAEAREQFAGHNDCDERIANLAARLGCPGHEPKVDWTFDPYPGMAALDHTQAPIFFGRETETDQLLALLDTPQGRRLVLVAGRSGSGKSSLVRAGLWARLHDAARPPLPGSAHWVISAMKPASARDGDPFLALCHGLREAGVPIPGLRDADVEARALRGDAGAFAALLQRILDGRPDGAEWLLIVDQFEELFTSVADDTRAAFLDRLLPALDLPRLRCVATVRSDFLDHCIAHPGLCAEIRPPGGALYPLDIPDPSALRRMITGPLRERVLAPARRATIDDDLVKRLVGDAGGRSGGLALLAYAVADLYQECRDAVGTGERAQLRMMLADYLRPAAEGDGGAGTGQLRDGLNRFIAKRVVAAAARAGLDTERVLPRVFGRLLTVAPDGAPTRLREDLAHWEADPEAVALIKELSAPDTRLLVLDARHDGTAPGAAAAANATHGRVVEVAHEALFHAWPALADWIERRKEALIRRPQLRREVARWDADGRPDWRVPKPDLARELRTLFEEAELWRDMTEKDADGPSVAHFLVRDDPTELLALVRRAYEAQASEPNSRAHLLHTLTRSERGSATLADLVEQVRAQDAKHGSDLVAWLRAGIDSDALFSGADAARWHWHRVAVGDLLDALGDGREGIGVDADGVPAIAWQPVPVGRFHYSVWGDEQERDTAAFQIARYPVTNRQFRAFSELPKDEYQDPRWWPRGFDVAVDPPWPQDNRPRVAVSWLEALAFCRWLTERLRAKGPRCGGIGLDEEIRLPTEVQWAKAARGTNRRQFPWGDDYASGDANIEETYAQERVGDLNLQQTIAVGLYPRNCSPYGLMDCSGNVWEWCLNKFDDVENTDLEGDEERGVRGGSWFNHRAAARLAARYRLTVGYRDSSLGLRLCRVGPIR